VEIGSVASDEAVPILFHLVLAVFLTLFLAYQARSLAFVLRSRRARRTRDWRRRPAELLWAGIPVLVVAFLAARSWIAVFDIERPAIAWPSAPAGITRTALPPPAPAEGSR
jgi:heme/copper-type cytochrome/quinol oxidase subunit 2